jgi:DNA polymerase III subunit delta'
MARLIEQIVGHKTEIEKLDHLIETQRWPHAMLFVGPSGIGKKMIAFAFAQKLVCEQPLKPCGVCGPCLRIEKKQSESLVIIEPDPAVAKEVIKVDAIRGLLDSLSFASLGTARVVIIDRAHKMNEQAANALLKTLEEPFENVYFILIGDDREQFLPTIKSRTQAIRYNVLTLDELRKIKPQQEDWAYRSSRGRVDLLERLTSPEGLQKREESLSLFEQFCEDPQFLLASEWRASLKDRTNAQFNLTCWVQILRDLVILKTQAQKFILNTDQIVRLKKLYKIQSSKLLWFAEQLNSAEKALLGNTDPILVFENLWVNYARMD